MLVKPGRMMSGRERPGYGTLAARILLSAASVAENATAGTAIGTLSVENGSGSYTFTIDTDTDGKFQIDGTGLEVGAALDYETATSHEVTISADNGVDAPILRTFTITVTNVADVPPDAFEASDWSVQPRDRSALVSIASLPAANEAAITDIEYRVDGGTWTSSAGIVGFTISGLTFGTEYDVELRAVSSVGASAASDLKTVTAAGLVLQLPFDGTDGATTTTDQSPSNHSLTFQANAQLDTAISKFGTASLLLDGSADRVTVASSSDFAFDALQPFTIHMWARCSDLSVTRNLLGRYNATGNQRSFLIALEANAGSPRLSLFWSGDGATPANLVTAGNTVSANTMHHIAVTRDASGHVRLFVDGVLLATGTNSIFGLANFNSSSLLTIGASQSASTGTNYIGHIDQLEIIKGAALWTASFTPPSSA